MIVHAILACTMSRTRFTEVEKRRVNQVLDVVKVQNSLHEGVLYCASMDALSLAG